MQCRAKERGACRMQDSKPLLTIAIPTYRRAPFLSELLDNLQPQLLGQPLVELLISDNASPDDTPQVVEAYKQRGLELKYVRNQENIGPDGNFVQCFELARGKYFLLFGDDDLVAPGAIAKIISLLQEHDADIVYLSSYSFSADAVGERKGDPLGRTYRVIEDPLRFARIVNLMLTFISGVIVNRDRFLEIEHAPISSFKDTMLVQLSWTLPLLQQHRRSLCVFERLVAGRVNNSGGYNIAVVFGVNLRRIAERLLPYRPRIAQSLSNAALRRWFPGAVFDLRSKGATALESANLWALLQGAHRGNPRLYLFVYPVLFGPLWMAQVWVVLTRAFNKLIYISYLPAFWRKR